jgi:hypothetical protein
MQSVDLFHFEKQNEMQSVDLFQNNKYLWRELLINPYVIYHPKLYKLLLDNKDHIDYYFLGQNPNIFENAI